MACLSSLNACSRAKLMRCQAAVRIGDVLQEFSSTTSSSRASASCMSSRCRTNLLHIQVSLLICQASISRHRADQTRSLHVHQLDQLFLCGMMGRHIVCLPAVCAMASARPIVAIRVSWPAHNVKLLVLECMPPLCNRHNRQVNAQMAHRHPLTAL